MPEPVTKVLKGLTTTHIRVLYVVVGFAFWFGQMKPQMESTGAAIRSIEVQLGQVVSEFRDVRTKVEVQAALITNLNDLKSDIKDLRNDLSLVHTRINAFKNP